MVSMSSNLLFTCLAFFGLGGFGLFHSNTLVWLMLSSPNALSHHCKGFCPTYSRICKNSDAHSLLRSIAKSHQATYMTQNRMYKISMSTQLCEILYTSSQVMLVLPSTTASCYYNCCSDGSTSPRN
jgi:hypothetical protein